MSQLRRCLGGRVGIEQPGVCLDDLAQRPEGDALAIWEAAALAPVHEVGKVVDEGEELRRQPALADAWLADDRDELDRPLPVCPAEEALEQLQLVVAPDEVAQRPPGDAVPIAAPRGGRAPDRDRSRLPFDPDRGEGLVLEEVPGHTVRRLAHEHPADGGHLLQSRGRVDDVPGHHPFPAGLLSEADHRLPAVDPDPDRQTEPGVGLVELVDRVDDREGAPDRPLGVVLVGDRRPEHGHHGVADELLRGTALPLDLLQHPEVEEAELAPDILGVGVLRIGGEPDQVTEQDGDDLAFLDACDRGVSRKSGPTGHAKGGLRGVLPEAARTRRHESSVSWPFGAY
jgi:hypothetical protein